MLPCHPCHHLLQVTPEPSLEVPSPLSLWDHSRTPPPVGDISASEHHGRTTRSSPPPARKPTRCSPLVGNAFSSPPTPAAWQSGIHHSLNTLPTAGAAHSPKALPAVGCTYAPRRHSLPRESRAGTAGRRTSSPSLCCLIPGATSALLC